MHLAPFRQGVLEQSSMSIWHTAPVKPERQEESENPEAIQSRIHPLSLPAPQTGPPEELANL